jgi:hypothetical protein
MRKYYSWIRSIRGIKTIHRARRHERERKEHEIDAKSLCPADMGKLRVQWRLQEHDMVDLGKGKELG